MNKLPSHTKYQSSGKWKNIPNVDYQNYAREKLASMPPEQKTMLEAMEYRLLKIPKMGEAGAAELLLKLTSYINGRARS
jgi:hypothetical protein